MVVTVISSSMRLSIRVTKQSPNANADSFLQDKKKFEKIPKTIRRSIFQKTVATFAASLYNAQTLLLLAAFPLVDRRHSYCP